MMVVSIKTFNPRFYEARKHIRLGERLVLSTFKQSQGRRSHQGFALP